MMKMFWVCVLCYITKFQVNFELAVIDVIAPDMKVSESGFSIVLSEHDMDVANGGSALEVLRHEFPAEFQQICFYFFKISEQKWLKLAGETKKKAK
jgi:hypothetical protein